VGWTVLLSPYERMRGNPLVIQMRETDESIPTPNTDDLTSKERLHWHLTSALASAESATTEAHLRGALAACQDFPPTPLVECPLCGKVGLPERIQTHECRHS
jgi:ribosomal protein L32